MSETNIPLPFTTQLSNKLLETILNANMTENQPPNNSKSSEIIEETAVPTGEEIPKRAIFIQYRGKFTEDYARKLHKIKAPCNVIMTLRKLKTVLPSLKPPVEKVLRSGVVYKIECAVCSAAYVG